MNDVEGASTRRGDILSDEKQGASSANKKARFIMDSEDKSELRTTVVKENHDGPLDKKSGLGLIIFSVYTSEFFN